MSPVTKKAAPKADAAAPKKRGRKPAAPKADAAAPKKRGRKPAAEKKAAPAKTTKTVTLSFAAEPGKTVFVAGSFNEWNETSLPMAAVKGGYAIDLELNPGLYEYKFLVDGVWTLDPDPDRDWTQNAFGTLNSLLRVE